ncbi:SRPBCC family protein [Telmatobacter sp. DSM 110680]|uniref:SRPBCC family protein n=1 Tax=Telmatobacter sp. DSM 110680 TaxID=3036704 RepID=A0AAU7DMI1_9BACT
MSSDKIEKRIELKAPVSRVWRALTDYREFGDWFKVKLDSPFSAGQISRGQITYPGYEHLTWEARIEKMEPERLFSFTWPHVQSFEKTDAPTDYTGAPRTLVEFRLKPIADGTLLTLTESGFDSIPADWRPEAFRRNDGGWTEQMRNIESHVTQNP